MAAITEQLKWLIDADASKAISAFEKTGKAAESGLGKAESSTAKIGSSLTKFGAGAAATAGVIGGALVKAAGSFEDLAIASGKFSTATGVSVQSASRWIEVTGDMGISSDSLESAMNKMNKTLGTSPGKFAELGVAIAHAKDGTVDVEGTFLNLTDRLNSIPNASDKAKVATALLGKGWTDLSSLIAEGSTNLKASLASVSEQKVISPEELAKAKSYRDSLDTLKDSVESLTLAIGQGAAPVIGAIAQALGTAVQWFDDLNAVTGGTVGRFAAIGAAGLGVAGVVSVIAGAGLKMVANLQAAGDAAGKMATKLRLKSTAEEVDATATEENAVAQGAAATAIDGNTAAVEANTLAKRANASTPLIGLGTAGTIVALGSSLGAAYGEAAGVQKALQQIDVAASNISSVPIDQLGDALDKFLAIQLRAGGLDKGGLAGQLDDLTKRSLPAAQRLRDALEAGSVSFGTKTPEAIAALNTSIDKYTAAAAAAANTTDTATTSVDDLGTVAAASAAKFGATGAALTKWADGTAKAVTGMQAFADATHGQDWGKTSLNGAVTAMSEFTAAHNGLIDINAASQKAVDDFTQSIKDNGKSFDVTTEKGRANQAALEDVASTIDTKLAAAYTDSGGDMDVFKQKSQAISDDAIKSLMPALKGSGISAQDLATKLGLLPEDIETRYKLSGDEEAKAKIGLLQGAIDNLPDDVQTTVTQKIIAGDYQGALATVQNYYNRNPAVVPVVYAPTKDLAHFRVTEQGGTIGPNEMGIAGEAGPEFVKLPGKPTVLIDGPMVIPPGTRVTSVRKTREILSRRPKNYANGTSQPAVVTSNASPMTFNFNQNAAIYGVDDLNRHLEQWSRGIAAKIGVGRRS